MRVCAAELGLVGLGKKCGRCSTRYCGVECQVQYWKEGGHDQLCKPIKSRWRRAVQRKYEIHGVSSWSQRSAPGRHKGPDVLLTCTQQALHWKTNRAFVRGCSCRGTVAAHVSCLAEQAKLLWAEAEEQCTLDGEALEAEEVAAVGHVQLEQRVPRAA